MLNNSRGVTLAELVVAMVIVTTAILAGMSSFKFITQAIRQSRTKTIAANLAQERMEVLKNLSYYELLVTTASLTDANWNITYDNGNYSPEVISLWGLPPFGRSVYVAYASMAGTSITTVPYSSNDTGLKELFVYVTWKDGDDYKKVQVNNLYTNPNVASLDSGFTGTVCVSPGVGSACAGGAALQGAKVEVVGNSNWAATSDATGRYSFAVAAGTYTVKASSFGYVDQSVNSLVASRGGLTTQNFSLVKIATGGIATDVWISSRLVVSQVVASTGAVDLEYVELFNPTTFSWTMNSANLELMYKANSGGSASSISLTFATTTVAAKSYYLIASTNNITVSGSQKAADAYYSGGKSDTIKDGDGGVGIRYPSAAAYYDKVAWAKTPGPDPPAELTETFPYGEAIWTGLVDGQQIVRMTSTGAVTGSLGNAYDTDNNLLNCARNAAITVNPRNSLSTATVVSGFPAYGAYAASNDALSVPASAETRYGGAGLYPYAHVYISNVATGTWSVTISSGGYSLVVGSAAVVTGSTTSITNATTSPSWPLTGANVSILTSSATGGFVQGFVYGSADFSQPLSNILVREANSNRSTRTSSNGYYLLNVSTGSVTVQANPNLDNSLYTSDSADGTVLDNQVSDVKAYPYFHLSRGGVIQGYVTSGTGALPNIPIKATGVSPTSVFEAVSGNTGNFYINAANDTYTVAPVLAPGQSYTTSPSPLTGTVNSNTIFVGTITVAGAMGTITGSVTEGGRAITTGVLVLASTGTTASPLSDPPVTVFGSSAPAMNFAIFMISSLADGTYSLPVRAGTYSMRAYYPIVDQNNHTVTYTSKNLTGVVVTAGGTSSGNNFAW